MIGYVLDSRGGDIMSGIWWCWVGLSGGAGERVSFWVLFVGGIHGCFGGRGFC